MDNPYKSISDIKQNMGLSRKKFADVINVSVTSVRRWENGNTLISRELFERIKKCMS